MFRYHKIIHNTIKYNHIIFNSFHLNHFTYSTKNNNNDNNIDFGYINVPYNEKEKLVKNVFDNVADKYDLMNDLMSLGIHRLWKDCFVNSIGLTQLLEYQLKYNDTSNNDIKMIDVAGGTGDIMFRILNEIKDANPSIFYDNNNILSDEEGSNNVEEGNKSRFVVCDINKEMLKVGEKRAKKNLLPSISSNIEWIHGNAEELPFDDDTFDIYTIAFGLRNVTDKQKALNEARRVVKPNGGRVLCLEFSKVDIPFIDTLYDLYSFSIIPTLGDIVADDKKSYQYLVESIRKFPSQQQLCSMFEDAGLQEITYENMSGGVVAIHSGYKI